MDVAIIDTPWNGVWQSMKIAAAAEHYEVNVAPHNFYGHLCTMMNAHFCAAVPNLRIMETDIDRLAWDHELFTHVPEYRRRPPDHPGSSGLGHRAQRRSACARIRRRARAGCSTTGRNKQRRAGRPHPVQLESRAYDGPSQRGGNSRVLHRPKLRVNQEIAHIPAHPHEVLLDARRKRTFIVFLKRLCAGRDLSDLAQRPMLAKQESHRARQRPSP